MMAAAAAAAATTTTTTTTTKTIHNVRKIGKQTVKLICQWQAQTMTLMGSKRQNQGPVSLWET
jgi:hypothetical protein